MWPHPLLTLQLTTIQLSPPAFHQLSVKNNIHRPQSSRPSSHPPYRASWPYWAYWAPTLPWPPWPCPTNLIILLVLLCLLCQLFFPAWISPEPSSLTPNPAGLNTSIYTHSVSSVSDNVMPLFILPAHTCALISKPQCSYLLNISTWGMGSLWLLCDFPFSFPFF